MSVVDPYISKEHYSEIVMYLRALNIEAQVVSNASGPMIKVTCEEPQGSFALWSNQDPEAEMGWWRYSLIESGGTIIAAGLSEVMHIADADEVALVISRFDMGAEAEDVEVETEGRIIQIEAHGASEMLPD